MKKTLIICNDLAIDDISLNETEEKNKENYKNEMINQENLMMDLINESKFTKCNLSELNTKFLQEFLMDFV